jgi:hypothetical protein
MADERWLTYSEAGELLALSPEAVRQRARRQRWRVTKGNDGKARVLVPEGFKVPDMAPAQPAVQPPGRTAGHRSDATVLLVEELAAARKRVDELTDRLTVALQGRASDAAALAGSEARELELRLALDHNADVIERLQAALDRARRPWWRRVFRGAA